MTYNFKSDFIPSDGQVGKLIMYLDGNVIGLNSSHDASLKPLFESYSIKEFLRTLPASIVIEERVNQHRDILHSGAIIGGTQYAVKGKNFLIAGRSTDFDTINVEAVKQCVKGLGFKVMSGLGVDNRKLEQFLNELGGRK